MYRQFDLRSDDFRLTAWLKEDPRLQPGVLVTLKGDELPRHWEILRVSTHRLEEPPHQRWQVGGLL
jgi:hypothetical protein